MDYYEILGVSQQSTDEDIKKAYKKWVRENHPDKNPDDESLKDKIKEINQAYSVLSDPGKRKEYDLRHQGSNSIFDDILRPFSNMHREVFRRDTILNIPGDDVFKNVIISLEESYRGTKCAVDIEELIDCESCEGSGGKPGARQVTCGTCAGLGHIEDPFNVSKSVCPSCHGRKTRPLSPCPACRGSCKKLTPKSILVSIPAGVASEDKLRITGKGKPGIPFGDLYLNIIIRNSEKTRRFNDDLIMEESIPLKVMMFGGIHQITTPWGITHEIHIHPNTAPGTNHEILNGGFKVKGRTGKILVVLNPKLPQIRSPIHKEQLLKILNEIENS